MSKPLFDASDESDIDDKLEIGTNKEYAKSYNSFRKKELLKKLKDRGYNNISDTDSSEDSESSDEDEGNLDESFDREFFKTLASLKSKDPTIYDKNTRFFSNNSDDEETVNDSKPSLEQNAKKTSKPVTLKDYERKVIIEHGGRFEDDSDEQSESEATKRPTSPTVVEEERRLKAEFKEVLEADDSADEEFGGIFKRRIKSKEEKTQEETDFAEWLAGKKADIEASTQQKLEPLKNYWNQRNLPQSERFLRDYILNKGYNNTKSADVPTYEEIVGDDEGPKALSDDERELEKQAEFEEKYNFRFEEPDAEFIKRFPRTIENSVRQEAGKRKEKRQETKQRKLAEKEQKMKELEILKEMKRKEIEEKIEKLKKVTGNDELGFKDDELEEDFDPEAHDRRMRELFNDEYYEVDEGEEKPECPSDIDELKIEDWDNYDPKCPPAFNDEPHCEDEDFNMDCDYDPALAKQQFQQELIDNTKKRKNRRGRRNRFMEMIQQEKPAFDPEDEKTYGDYIDEYYKMDCEDIIDDIPCRFKYIETVPNDFGLTLEEILLAKNKELNQWASLKKTLQIRPEQVEKRDQRLYKMKAKNEALKRKIFKSLYGENSDDEDDSENEVQNNVNKTETEIDTSKQNSKKKVKLVKTNESAAIDIKDEPETKKPKIDEHNEISTSKDINSETLATSSDKKKKKRKKKKSQNQNLQTDSANAQVQPKSNTVPESPVKSEQSTQKPKENPFKKPQNSSSQTTQTASSAKKKKNKNKKQQNQQTNNFNNSSSTNSSVPILKPDLLKTAASESKTTDESFDTKPKENPFKMVRKDDAPKFDNGKQNGKPKFNKKFNKKSKLDQKSKPKFKAFNKRKNNGNRASKSDNVKVNDERLKAYNINPRKFHKTQKFGKNKTN